MVTLRRAHEKTGRPSGGRWGRRDDVPIEVYYEFDDMARQLEGLRSRSGLSRETATLLAKASAILSSDVTQPDESKTVVEFPFSVQLGAASATASATPLTTEVTLPFVWRFETITLTPDIATGTPPYSPVVVFNVNEVNAFPFPFPVTDDQPFFLHGVLGDLRRKRYAAGTTFGFGFDFSALSGPPTATVVASIFGFASLNV
jgi:hypothetical protein